MRLLLSSDTCSFEAGRHALHLDLALPPGRRLMHRRLQELGLKASVCQPVVDQIHQIRSRSRSVAASGSPSHPLQSSSPTTLNGSWDRAPSVSRSSPAAASAQPPGMMGDFEDVLRRDPYLALTGVRGIGFRWVSSFNIELWEVSNHCVTLSDERESSSTLIANNFPSQPSPSCPAGKLRRLRPAWVAYRPTCPAGEDWPCCR